MYNPFKALEMIKAEVFMSMPASVVSNRCEAASHSRIVSSSATEATVRPSGEYAELASDHREAISFSGLRSAARDRRPGSLQTSQDSGKGCT